MRRARAAEWILGQVMTNDRAAAITGDLSESDRPTQIFKFWLSVMGIVLASTWMWLIALAVGIYLAAWSVVFLNDALFGQALRFFWTPYHIPPVWNRSLDVLAQLSTILLLVAPYVLVRYGFKDKFVRVLLGSLGLLAGITLFWWQPIALAVCAIAGATGMVACMCTRERQRALGMVAVTATAGLFATSVAAWLISLVHSPAFGCELQGCVAGNPTPALGASQVLVAIPIVVVCTLMHQRLMEGQGSKIPQRLQTS